MNLLFALGLTLTLTLTGCFAKIHQLPTHSNTTTPVHIVQSVKDRPGPKDSGLVAWEASWRESKTAEPSDNMLRKECGNAPGCNVQ